MPGFSQFLQFLMSQNSLAAQITGNVAKGLSHGLAMALAKFDIQKRCILTFGASYINKVRSFPKIKNT